MKPLDNYLVVLSTVVHELGLPLREDGWPVAATGPAALAFHLGRFLYHAARIEVSTSPPPVSRGAH